MLADLAILATDPTYQGRGVARELVQWGLSRAEAEGVEAYLEAGPAVLGFYIKLGFDKVATMVVAGVDPGEDGMQNEIYCMVSKPRSISCE